MKVRPKLLLRAERELAARFPVARRSIEKLLIDALKEEAARAGADWDIVLRADGAARQREWKNLLMLVSRAIPNVERQLMETARTLLLVYPGTLARYDQLDVLGRLRDRVGSLAHRTACGCSWRRTRRKNCPCWTESRCR